MEKEKECQEEASCSSSSSSSSATHWSNLLDVSAPFETLFQGIVKLNIGGVKYVTTGSTLTRNGPNFFTALLSGRIPSFQDQDGYFIDRNGGLFAPILEMLRTGELEVPPGVSLTSLQREADFYSIPLPTASTNQQPKQESITEAQQLGGILQHEGVYLCCKIDSRYSNSSAAYSFFTFVRAEQ
ncbi:BTB/POZ domain-containing protein kctd16 [Balamuthia mandrillaris]